MPARFTRPARPGGGARERAPALRCQMRRGLVRGAGAGRTRALWVDRARARLAPASEPATRRVYGRSSSVELRTCAGRAWARQREPRPVSERTARPCRRPCARARVRAAHQLELLVRHVLQGGVREDACERGAVAAKEPRDAFRALNRLQRASNARERPCARAYVARDVRMHACVYSCAWATCARCGQAQRACTSAYRPTAESAGCRLGRES